MASQLGYATGALFSALTTPFLVLLSPITNATRLAGILPALHAFVPYGFHASEIPDLKGKTYVVTGANSGLGLGTTILLANAGATVIMGCRSRARAEAAKKSILAEHSRIKPEQLVLIDLDNASLKSVKQFCREVYKLNLPHLDGLDLNAGGARAHFGMTEDGVEEMFAVDHLAHFALTNELLPLLQKAPKAAVVGVSSLAHFMSYPWGVGLDEATINDKSKFTTWGAYGAPSLGSGWD